MFQSDFLGHSFLKKSKCYDVLFSKDYDINMNKFGRVMGILPGGEIVFCNR